MYNWIYAYYYETVHEIYISFNIYISWRVRLKNEMRKNANKQTKQRKIFLNEKWKEKFVCTWCVYLNFNIWLEERLFLRRSTRIKIFILKLYHIFTFKKSFYILEKCTSIILYTKIYYTYIYTHTTTILYEEIQSSSSESMISSFSSK